MTEQKNVSRLARYVSDRVYQLSDRRNQREIATMSGYVSQNMITMIKKGFTKVSIDRVPDLAHALDCDRDELMKMALEQFYSAATIKVLSETFGKNITKNETFLIDVYRRETKGADPIPTAAILNQIALTL